MGFWPTLLYPDILDYIMFYPAQLGSTHLSDYKIRKLIAVINLVPSGNIFPQIIWSKYCIFKSECLQSQRINEINHQLSKIMEKCGKIRSWHHTCMAGMGQPYNHVADAMYRTEAAVRNGFTTTSCTCKVNQWLSNQKDVPPMKVKNMNFGPEDFVRVRRKNDHLCRHQRKNIIPLVNKRIWKCLHWMILLMVWAMFDLKVLFSVVPKLLILLQILLRSILMTFMKIYAAFLIGLVNQLILRIFLQIYLLTCQKKKYQTLNYWNEDKTITNWGKTTGKELLQSQKFIMFWPK